MPEGILQRLQQDVLHGAVDGHAQHEQESGDQADRERRQPPAHAARDGCIRVGGAAERPVPACPYDHQL